MLDSQCWMPDTKCHPGGIYAVAGKMLIMDVDEILFYLVNRSS
jgi:hypothetical protein